MPPFETRTQALEVVEQMVTDDIQDIYVIPRGDMANAISLGLYSREASLDRRLTELNQKGFQPSVAPRYESKKAAWYDVELDADITYSADDFSANFPDVESTRRRCS